MRALIGFGLLLGLASMPGCASTPEELAEDRAEAMKVHDEALAELFEREPGTKETIKTAKGYAVTGAGSLHLGVVSLALGRVIIVDNKTAEKKVHDGFFRFALGPGFAIKTMRGVYIIHDDETMKRFVDEPWAFMALIEASCRFGSWGGSLADVTGFGDEMNEYYWCQNGIALEAALGVAKLWHNKLNEEPAASK